MSPVATCTSFVLSLTKKYSQQVWGHQTTCTIGNQMLRVLKHPQKQTIHSIQDCTKRSKVARPGIWVP